MFGSPPTTLKPLNKILTYPGGESNPDLEFRKLSFYPLNYQGVLS